MPHRQLFLTTAISLVVLSLYSASPLCGQDVTINIRGSGSAAQYIEEGQNQELPVHVQVGQTVRWNNLDRRSIHTATAFRESDGQIIFDTGDIRSNMGSAEVEMTREVFELAGGEPGGEINIDYECDYHGQMTSRIVLRDGDDGRQPPRTVRRDIRSLSPMELREYRDAWRTIQANGEFNRLAAFHGCPNFFCAHGDGLFLVWHREYMLRLEKALQDVDPSVALHYWNWNSEVGSSEGIPQAFLDSSYESGGRTFPNPLRRFAYSCPAGTPTQTTRRFPGMPGELGFFAREVAAAYLSLGYSQLNSSLERPHGSVHVWVGGHMGSPFQH